MDGDEADGLRVRPATELDLPVIRILREALYAEFPPPSWRDESWDARGEDVLDVVRGGGAFVAERAGRAIGFALAWPDGRSAIKLGDLYVRPEHRATGVGRSLVSSVAGLADAAGVEVVHLTANLEAFPFYSRLSFAEESRNLAARVDELLS